MFGKEYAKHLDILTQSLEQINEKYQNRTLVSNKETLVNKLKTVYISLFGIPEIGFQIRSLYFNKIFKFFLSKKELKSIFDAGSGIGAYTFLLSNSFPTANITGGEIDKFKIKSSQTLAKEFGIKNVKFVYADITKNNKTALYDCIVTIDVLEHIESYQLALKNFSRLLKKRGFLYIHVPQPNQKRIFSALKEWHHEDHAHEGISKQTMEKNLEKLGFTIITAQESFGFFGKLAWELNHLALSKSFTLAGLIYPFLYPLAKMDLVFPNKNGLGVALLAQKK